MEHDDEESICGYCGCEVCCPDGFKQHFIFDHYDIVKKYAKELGISPSEWMQLPDN